MVEVRRRLGRLRIRTRIALGSLVVALALAVPSGVILDLRIEQIVRLGTAQVLTSDQRPYVADLQAGLTTGFEKPGSGAHIAVIAPDGTRRVDTLTAPVRNDLASLVQDDETRAVTTGGRPYLVRSQPVSTPTGLWHVVAARDGSSEEAVLAPMRQLLVGILVVVVLGVTAGAWLIAALSLRPVSRLRETAARLRSASGDELLPVGRTGDEIARLATTLNDLVSDLREAAERERRLVSDASHELRTPVAVVRTRLELARSGGGDEAALRRDIADAERAVVRLGALLDSLLELSSIQAGGHAATSAVDDLEDEVRDAIDRAGFRGGRAVIRFESSIDSGDAGARVRIAAADVGRIVDNLIGNSIAAFDGRDGRILVALQSAGDVLRLTVIDDAGGLPEGLGSGALDRFTRGPDARRGSGSGLGLAIVRALAESAGGSVTLDDRPGEGLGVTLMLPFAHPGNRPGAAHPVRRAPHPPA